MPPAAGARRGRVRLRGNRGYESVLRDLGEGSRGELEVLAKRPLELRCGARASGSTELEDLPATEGQAEATCEFCTTRYVIPGEELRTLIGAVSPG